MAPRLLVRSVPARPVARRLGGTLRSALSGVLAGAAGTAAMTTTALLHRAVHQRLRGALAAGEILDYDDSEYVVIAASTVLRTVTGRAPTTPAGRKILFLVVHWGYGSVVGVAHRGLYTRLRREPAAGIAFFAGCQTMALSLFPLLGGTPPPWRWRRDLLVTSVVQHAIYAAAVAATTAALPPPDRPARTRR